jgi:hypothetical protein
VPTPTALDGMFVSEPDPSHHGSGFLFANLNLFIRGNRRPGICIL